LPLLVVDAGVGQQRCALVRECPHAPRAVRQQPHALEVGACPRQPIRDLGPGAVVVQFRLLVVGEAFMLDHRFHHLADGGGPAELGHREERRPEELVILRDLGRGGHPLIIPGWRPRPSPDRPPGRLRNTAEVPVISVHGQGRKHDTPGPLVCTVGLPHRPGVTSA